MPPRPSLQELKLLALRLPSLSVPEYTTAEDLRAIIQGYFNDCIAEDRPPTMTGLSKLLGMSRTDLVNSIRNDSEFASIINLAKLSIIEYVEEMLLSGKASINLIFWLKNNASWIDKTEVVNHSKTAAEILQELQRLPTNQPIDGQVVS